MCLYERRRSKINVLKAIQAPRKEHAIAILSSAALDLIILTNILTNILKGIKKCKRTTLSLIHQLYLENRVIVKNCILKWLHRSREIKGWEAAHGPISAGCTLHKCTHQWWYYLWWTLRNSFRMYSFTAQQGISNFHKTHLAPERQKCVSGIRTSISWQEA